MKHKVVINNYHEFHFLIMSLIFTLNQGETLDTFAK